MQADFAHQIANGWVDIAISKTEFAGYVVF